MRGRLGALIPNTHFFDVVQDMAGWEAGRREAQSEHKREFEEKAAENKRLQDQIQFLENELKRLEQQHAETLKDKDVEISR